MLGSIVGGIILFETVMYLKVKKNKCFWEKIFRIPINEARGLMKHKNYISVLLDNNVGTKNYELNQKHNHV
jgi:hypothetical protein